MKTIAESWSRLNNIPFTLLGTQIFNPFEWNEDNELIPLYDSDPDLQYFNDNTYVDNDISCDYYIEETFNKKCSESSLDTSNLSFLHLNIRSLPRHVKDLENYLSNLNINFTIIGLTETWLNKDIVDLYNLKGYQHQNLFRTNKRGGGVSLLVKEGITMNVRDDLNCMSSHIESLFVEIPKCDINCRNNLLVGVIYRPPNTDINDFNETLSELLTKIKNENKTVYLLGDFNINLLEHQNHLPTSDFIDSMYTSSLFPFITKPTRISKNTATLIDNIFCNDITKKYFNGVLYTDISDHLPVFCINIDCKRENRSITSKTRIISDKTIEKFGSEITMVDWQNVLSNNNGPEAFNHFYEKFTGCFNNCFPEKVRKVNYRNRKPWLSQGLKTAIKNKNKLYVKSSKSPTPQNISKYKSYKSQLSKLLKQSERDYYDSLLKENKNNLRNMWNILKEVINKKKTTVRPSRFKIGGSETQDPGTIANGFNNFFVNIGNKIYQRYQSKHNISKTCQ
jgi:hypothetical protein